MDDRYGDGRVDMRMVTVLGPRTEFSLIVGQVSLGTARRRQPQPITGV